MLDIIQPIIVILIGGIIAPVLTQLLEKLYEIITGSKPIDKPDLSGDKLQRRKKWLRFFGFAIVIQLLMFTAFFVLTKLTYFDKNYYETSEQELIHEGLKKNKDYIISKITIRIDAESNQGIPARDSSCNDYGVNYCALVSISYDIVALRDFKAEKIFPEQYDVVYASNVIKEPGSEEESEDQNPSKSIAAYDVITTMKKYEHKTITTRADYLYDSLPLHRKFFEKELHTSNEDLYYYPNKEDDVIGEVEFQVFSRTLKFENPSKDDAVFKDEKGVKTSIATNLGNSKGGCLKYNIITANITSLKNNQSFGVRWAWSK